MFKVVNKPVEEITNSKVNPRQHRIVVVVDFGKRGKHLYLPHEREMVDPAHRWALHNVGYHGYATTDDKLDSFPSIHALIDKCVSKEQYSVYAFTNTKEMLEFMASQLTP